MKGRRDVQTGFPDFGVRHFGRINGLGLWTLYRRELSRFLRSYPQTLLGPVIVTLLFLTIFSVALGAGRPTPNGIPFATFLAPGLIMMTVIQNAFAHGSSSIMFSKVQGNIVDLLMPPLSAGEITFGLTMGSATRGIACAALAALCLWPLAGLSVAAPWAVLYFTLAGSLILSLIGIMTGIWADKIDHMATITNFVILPLSYLSGTFYSVAQLPGWIQQFAAFNPFFYLIDGLRYGFTGHADAPPVTGVLVTAALIGMLWLACWRMFARGYKLKS